VTKAQKDKKTKMTQEQALDILKLGYNVFLTGAPGTGKTFLLNKYIDYLRNNGKSVAVTASTGIAATHMGGITIHSWSGIGIKEMLSDGDIKKLRKRSYLKKRFQKTNVLIIDEISMLHAFQFDLVDRICRAFKNSPKPFGGMQVVCSGDLFQLPPVQKRGEAASFVIRSQVWKNMDIKICYLEKQYRQEGEHLLSLLNHIRNNAAEEAKAILLDVGSKRNTFSIAPTRLYTHNIDVDTINDVELRKIEEEEFVYYMHSRGSKNIASSLRKNCLAPEKLVLKKRAKVMFVKNNFDKGYVNGTLGMIVGFDENGLPIVKVLSGSRITAEPARWTFEEDGEVKAEVSQIPLRLAWAITVHKSQGMNLDAAEIDLSKSFVEGMGYVALSRLRKFSGLKLLGINEIALLINQEILELDKIFEQMSGEIVKNLEEFSFTAKKKEQKKFLSSLSGEEEVKRKKKKKPERISTYKQTKSLVDAKLSIQEIAASRGLTENTILQHLEKIVADGERINLEYLEISEERFEQIKTAFEQIGGDYRLKPVRETLGQEFSYQELRLVRLFIQKP
jgi:ATP-dependent DNA helicase PIF1